MSINKTKYYLMYESEVADDSGNKYPDLTSFPINNFIAQTKGIDYKLSYNDIYKFYNLINSFYSDYQMYDDVTLWLNDIENLSLDSNFGKIIKLYKKDDIDRWYTDNIK